EAARQFEALFVQMMLKSMRDANSVLAEDKDTTYQEMFDQQIALELTREKGLGIADLLVRQMMQGVSGQEDSKAVDQGLLTDRIEQHSDARALPSEAAETATASPAQRQDFRPDGPESFLQQIWDLAKHAGEALGVDPRAVAAQATLETGWGQRLIRDHAGISGNNLFGIKADSSWDGERVGVRTLEYENGLPKQQHAQFRAYPDLQQGFQDYVDFLKNSPRYAEAIAGVRDAVDFARSLQDAGYATDPDYAAKIEGIMQSPRFARVIDGLMQGGDPPTSM
ncbi:MAG TPA: flagellar assembly peptidoglycan hydrolase FlgJ, partial [Chromatiales bacterium]|nr:flagellar assembly peptidoglycan hydrolase FlgJ [Chromatiales bacterium]